MHEHCLSYNHLTSEKEMVVQHVFSAHFFHFIRSHASCAQQLDGFNDLEGHVEDYVFHFPTNWCLQNDFLNLLGWIQQHW